MKKELKEQLNIALTENGGLAYQTTGSACLDLFCSIGAMRNNYSHIIKMFSKAYSEDNLTALKIMFYGRDIRGGAGERNTFRILLNYFANFYPEIVRQKPFINGIAKYGRYDDYLVCLNTPSEGEVVSFLKKQLFLDIENNKNNKGVSLLAKWLPSVNTSSKASVALAKKLAKCFGLSEKQYRKTLVELRKGRIVENNLRLKGYSFNYANVPSMAMFKYRKAFLRNDLDRYLDFIKNNDVNAETLFPYQIVHQAIYKECLSAEQKAVLDATWRGIKRGSVESGTIVVLDGSGSMYGYGKPKPIEVAISLAILFAEQLEGEFKNTFITFSEKPQLVELPNADIVTKVETAMEYCEVANTDLLKVFKLILKTAKANKMSPSQMPKRIVVISDMEFDECEFDGQNETLFKTAKGIFARAGYELPQVVFWNVQARNRQFPVTKSEAGVILVSGASKNIISQVVTNSLQVVTPYEQMQETLKRYNELNDLVF